VELLVLGFDIDEDVHGFVGGRRVDHDFLEAAVEGAVFFDMLAVFIQGGSADALQFAACQGRFEDVGGVERAGGAAGADDGVNFVDEEDDVAAFLQFVHDGLHALFELAAVLGAGDQGCQVEHDDALAEEGARHFFLDDAQGQSFDDGCFADAGFADEDGVVFLAAAQDLGDAFDLVFAADDGVEFAFFRQAVTSRPKLSSTGVRDLVAPLRW
jgi:hypothetical protein